MSNIQAALGVAQLERLDEKIAFRQRIYMLYKELMGDQNEVSLLTKAPVDENAGCFLELLDDDLLGEFGGAVRVSKQDC